MRVSKRVWGVGLLNILVVLGGLVQALLLNSPTAASKDAQEQRTILTPAFSIKLPDFPFPMAWSQDSKWIAISGFNTLNVRLVDVENQKLTDKIIARGMPNPLMAWSPDGRMVAIITTLGLRLVSTEDGTEIVKGPKQAGKCWFPSLANNQTPIAAFTPDGKSLWVACLAANSDPSYTAAVKLAVPTLELEDSIEDNAPVPGLRTACNVYIISTQGQDIFLHRSVLSFLDQSEKNTPREFLSVWNLSTKSPLFEPIEVATQTGEYWAFQKAFVSNKNRTLIYRQVYSDTPAFAVFDNISRSLISVFGESNDFNRAQTHHAAVSNDGQIAFASLIENWENNIGGLAVWNAATGQLLQLIKGGAGHNMSLSPDGKTLAVFDNHGTLQFYNVTS